MEESKGIPVQLAVASSNLDASKLSYSVDKDGTGTLIGNEKAAEAKALINVYPSSSSNKSERLNDSDIEADASGGFSAITFDNAPDTVYVTQQTSSGSGVMLESIPVSIEKADTSVVTPLNVVKETDSSGMLVNLNKVFTVEGVVTVENSVLGTQKTNFYIQDETGGINVFGYDAPSTTIQRGDKLKITGMVDVYNGLTELVPTSIKKVSEGNPLPEAKEITIEELRTFTVAEPLEGSVVKVTGQVSAVSTSGSNWNVTLVDGNNKTTTVRVMEKTEIKADEVFVIGKSYSVTGIVGQYTTNKTHLSGYQVFPRDMQDVAAQLGIDHEPLTEVYKNANVEFVANASGAESVVVYYRAKEADDYIALPMAAGDDIPLYRSPSS